MKTLSEYLYYHEPGPPDIKIYHGDCLEIMPLLDKVDLVVTDPPYGINMDKGFEGSQGFNGKGSKIIRRRYETDNWDSERPSKEVFDLILKSSKEAFIFGGNFFSDLLPVGNHWIVWDKLNTMPTFGDCELIWTNLERNSVKKITVQYNGLLGEKDHRQHPTQKPLLLLRKVIQQCKYWDTPISILDPFLGSGTTLVACKELKRNGIGIEINEKYCQIAKRRLMNTQVPML